jgi:hypothetical protein
VVALVVVVAVARRRVKLSLLYHRHEKRELQELEALKSLEELNGLLLDKCVAYAKNILA